MAPNSPSSWRALSRHSALLEEESEAESVRSLRSKLKAGVPIAVFPSPLGLPVLKSVQRRKAELRLSKTMPVTRICSTDISIKRNYAGHMYIVIPQNGQSQHLKQRKH